MMYGLNVTKIALKIMDILLKNRRDNMKAIKIMQHGLINIEIVNNYFAKPVQKIAKNALIN